MKHIAILLMASLSAIILASCQKTDEIPPMTDRQATSYRLPDPEPLTGEDRVLIEQQEKEYNDHAE